MDVDCFLASLAAELQLKEEDLEKLLRSRRKKFQKKLDPKYQAPPVQEYLPVDPALCDESENVYQEMCEARNIFFSKWEEWRTTVKEVELKQLREEKESFHARLAQKKSTGQERRNRLEADKWPSPRQDFIKDLEATCAQLEALSEIRKMKHTMTPKTPALHNRLLSGNIYNQSLGLFNNTVLLDGSGGEDESQTDYSHLHLIGDEVSITQEESEGVVPDMYDVVEQASASYGGCNDVDSDTPGIGMEVICVGGLDKDMENSISAEGRQLLQNLRPDFRFPKQPVTSPDSPPSTVPKALKKKRGRPKKQLDETPHSAGSTPNVQVLTPKQTPLRKSARTK